MSNDPACSGIFKTLLNAFNLPFIEVKVVINSLFKDKGFRSSGCSGKGFKTPLGVGLKFEANLLSFCRHRHDAGTLMDGFVF